MFIPQTEFTQRGSYVSERPVTVHRTPPHPRRRQKLLLFTALRGPRVRFVEAKRSVAPLCAVNYNTFRSKSVKMPLWSQDGLQHQVDSILSPHLGRFGTPTRSILDSNLAYHRYICTYVCVYNKYVYACKYISTYVYMFIPQTEFTQRGSYVSV